jgi:hypothetical protein
MVPNLRSLKVKYLWRNQPVAREVFHRDMLWWSVDLEGAEERDGPWLSEELVGMYKDVDVKFECCKQPKEVEQRNWRRKGRNILYVTEFTS